MNEDPVTALRATPVSENVTAVPRNLHEEHDNSRNAENPHENLTVMTENEQEFGREERVLIHRVKTDMTKGIM